ncbi:hypothetical protein A3L04_06345 [Thermococcus chitonophagus]|uniref:Uncharacterized protein n=1 Tax=Thermococcus chitonophagus TaxID=54262 RepID=A0A160VSZ4_9EURY|nr:hypothetical protein [Thermococcus chitonophagus]ASJ16717.1 hypothetical protein A3L04_06345 [Thermococcus chitonophagus]CUX78185.1 hypothetical protein CHITON_1406 [Thermococcus chitonophagus]
MAWLAVFFNFSEEVLMRLVDLSEVQAVDVSASTYKGGLHFDIKLLLRGGEVVAFEIPATYDIEKIIRDLNVLITLSKSQKNLLDIFEIQESGLVRRKLSEIKTNLMEVKSLREVEA